MVPSTLDIVPSTLDPRQKPRLTDKWQYHPTQRMNMLMVSSTLKVTKLTPTVIVQVINIMSF